MESCECRNRLNRITLDCSATELAELKNALGQCESQCGAQNELLKIILSRLKRELRKTCSQEKFDLFLEVNQEENHKEFDENTGNPQRTGNPHLTQPPAPGIRPPLKSPYITILGETNTYPLDTESPVIIGASSPYNCTYLIAYMDSQIKLEINPKTNQMNLHETQSDTANAAIKKARSQLIQGECYLLGNSRLNIGKCCKNEGLSASITYNGQTQQISLEPGESQIIGREFLSFSDSTMSRNHATIYSINSIWVIEMVPEVNNKLYRFLHKQKTLSQQKHSHPITIKIGDEIRFKDTLINIIDFN